MGIARNLLGIGLALLLSACGLKEAYENSNAAVAQFHKGLDAEQYQALWQGSTPKMKQAMGEADFVKLMNAVHTKLGKVKASKQTGLNVNSTNGVTTVQAQMQTEFEKGKAQETFIFLQQDGRLLLQEYNIQSPELIIK